MSRETSRSYMREASVIEMNTTTYTPGASSSGTAPRPRTIVGVISADQTLTAEGLIWLVASAGQTSDDPLVQDIVAYAHEHHLRLALSSGVQAVSCGLKAHVDGRDVLLGSCFALLRESVINRSVATQARMIEAAGFLIVYAVVDDMLAGGIVLGGDPRQDTNVNPGDLSGGL
jgi:cation transport ATPase